MTASTDESSGYPALEMVLDTIAGWVRKFRHASGLRAELARCDSEEVARTAHDLGMSARELVGLASKGPHAADQLLKLLSALGIDPKALAFDEPATMRDLQRLCITCGHKGRCEHELAVGTAAESYRDFCPNAFTLEALRKVS
jgi:hypothetical protein